jgi:hypothetical protein
MSIPAEGTERLLFVDRQSKKEAMWWRQDWNNKRTTLSVYEDLKKTQHNPEKFNSLAL